MVIYKVCRSMELKGIWGNLWRPEKVSSRFIYDDDAWQELQMLLLSVCCMHKVIITSQSNVPQSKLHSTCHYEMHLPKTKKDFADTGNKIMKQLT